MISLPLTISLVTIKDYGTIAIFFLLIAILQNPLYLLFVLLFYLLMRILLIFIMKF